MNAFLRRMRHQFRLLEFRFRNLGKDVFTCPVCGYSGPFRDLSAETGLRKHAECPSCGAKERHRIQYVAFLRLKQAVDTKSMSLLHFAPEAFFRQIFQQNFADYVTADIAMKNVDHQVDLRKLPFSDHSFDVVYASHVLEHIDDDRSALKEIRRILKPNGIAILPVPIVADRTVEYPCPNPHESGHVRAPGPDYFERYKDYFETIELVTSASCKPQFQCFTFEDRSRWPTENMPLRLAMNGDRHEDYVPICFVSQPSAEVAHKIIAADI